MKRVGEQAPVYAAKEQGSRRRFALIFAASSVAATVLGGCGYDPFARDCEKSLDINGSLQYIRSDNYPDTQITASAMRAVGGIKLVLNGGEKNVSKRFEIADITESTAKKTPLTSYIVGPGTALEVWPYMGPKSDPANPDTYTLYTYCVDAQTEAAEGQN